MVFIIFGVTVATILAVIATMGGGGILARTWGKSELVDKFQRNKETFLVHNWYFKRGFTIVIIIIAIIFFYNHSKHHDNSIRKFYIIICYTIFYGKYISIFFCLPEESLSLLTSFNLVCEL